MNLSFATELDSNLADAFAFFSDCCSKVIKEDEHFLVMNETESQSTVVIMPPINEPNKLDEIAELPLGLEKNDLIFLKNSAFIYNNYNSKTTRFPRLKIELGINQVNSVYNSLNDLNISNHSDANDSGNSFYRKGSITEQSLYTHGNVDSQSISSNNAQSQLISTQRKLKIPNTPVGVRTNVEKLQSQRVSFNLSV